MESIHSKPTSVGGLHEDHVLLPRRDQQRLHHDRHRETWGKTAAGNRQEPFPPFSRLPVSPRYRSSSSQKYLTQHPSGLPQLHISAGGLSFSGGKHRPSQAASADRRTRKGVPQQDCIARNKLSMPSEEHPNRPCKNPVGGYRSLTSDNCNQSSPSTIRHQTTTTFQPQSALTNQLPKSLDPPTPATSSQTLVRNRQWRAGCRGTPCQHSRPFTPYSYCPTFYAAGVPNPRIEPCKHDPCQESTEASASETCSFEDALTSLSRSSSSSNVAQVIRASDDLRSSGSPTPLSINPEAAPIVAHQMFDCQFAPELNSTMEKASLKANELKGYQSVAERLKREMESMTDETPNSSCDGPTTAFPDRSSDDVFVLPLSETCQASSRSSPQPRLVKARRSDSFEMQIPGRYFSICEVFEEDLAISAEGTQGSPTCSPSAVPVILNNDSPVSPGSPGSTNLTPAASLIHLLNQWEKVPTTQEMPKCFVEKLRDALDTFENWRLMESDDQRASTLTGTSFENTSSSDSCKSFEPTRSNPRDTGVILADHSHPKSIDPSTEWTPFSERSRIPASRQIGSTVKFQILPRRAGLAVISSPDSVHDFPTSPLSNIHASPLVSTTTISVTEVAESSLKHEDRPARRKKNLHDFLGTNFGVNLATKTKAEIAENVEVQPHRRSDGKTSLTAELTKTVKGLRPSKYHLSLPSKHSEPFKNRSDGFLSDCNSDSNRCSSLSLRAVNHRRLNSELGNTFDRLQISDSSQKLTAHAPGNKKIFGVRFE